MSTTKSLKESSPLDFLNLVTFYDQWYHIHGDIPTVDKCVESGIPSDLVQSAICDSDFISALNERGITINPAEGWASKSLTPQQLVIANQLLDLTDRRSNKKKLQDAGVTTGKYQAWLRDPAFSSYLHMRAKQLLPDSQHEAYLALQDKVADGDLKAIEYLFEMTGVHVRPRAGANQVDVNGIIVKIIDIIDEELPEGEVKAAIAGRLKQLITNTNAASALTGVPSPVGALALSQAEETIEQPVVVPIRQLDVSNHKKGTLI